MKNISPKNFTLLLAVLFLFSSCASMKARKDPNAQYMGEWEYVVEELPVDIDGTMVLSSEEGVIKCSMINPQGDIEIEGLTITDGALKAEFKGGGYPIDLEGQFEGDSYNGLLLVEGTGFVMKAKKVK